MGAAFTSSNATPDGVQGSTAAGKGYSSLEII